MAPPTDRNRTQRWLEDGVGDVRVPLEPLQLEIADTDCVEDGARFAGPDRIVELIQRDHRALRHTGQQVFDSRLRGLVEIDVKKQKTHHQVWVFLYESGHRLDEVAFNEVDLV